MLKYLLTILCLLFSTPAWAVLTVGNVSTADTGASTTETGLTWSHNNNGDGLLVGFALGVRDDDYNNIVCSATYNGIAMTKAVGQQGASSTSSAVEIYQLIAPAAGANNVVLTCDDEVKVVGGAVSFLGSNQTTLTENVSGDTGGFTDPTINVTSAVGDIVFAVLMGNTDWTACAGGSGETERWDVDVASGGVLGCGFTEAGAASVTIFPSMTPNDADYRILMGLSVKAAPAATTRRPVAPIVFQ